MVSPETTINVMAKKNAIIYIYSSNIFYHIEGYNYENNVNSEIYHAVWFRIDQKVFVAPCIISDGNNVDDLIFIKHNHKENSVNS